MNGKYESKLRVSINELRIAPSFSVGSFPSELDLGFYFMFLDFSYLVTIAFVLPNETG